MGLWVWKFRVAGSTLLASNSVEYRLNTARGYERCDRLFQVACQVSDLALEMTDDALRYAQRMHTRRWASERALRLSFTTISASLHHQAFAVFKRSVEKEQAAQ